MARTAKRHKLSEKQTREFRGQLLDWYDSSARKLPWRALPGITPDPYHVWLSEIMLQQTTVNAVIPYYLKFLKKWPKIKNLADAPSEEVMKEWAGLGYYARARNLHACAKIIAYEFKGKFPQTQEELKKLPGIGEYTSAAITVLTTNKPANVVDGNVERVMARYFAIQETLPKSKPLLKSIAAPFYEGFEERPGDLAQAFMDLGATICIPAGPRCGLCPVTKQCRGRIQKIAAELPRKEKPARRVVKRGYVYWIENSKGQVLLHRRPEKGMLGGMVGLPTSDWVKAGEQVSFKDLRLLNAKTFENLKQTSIFHSFTHFDLELNLQTAALPNRKLRSDSYFWQDRANLHEIGFPTLFSKAANIFLKAS